MQLEDILRSVRTEVPIISGDRIDIPFEIHGDLPASLKLPIFGSRDNDDEKCLNSGGRGFLLTHEGKTYRFKGNDIFGTISVMAGFSPKTLIADVNLVAAMGIEQITEPTRFEDNLFENKIYHLSTYQNKPFAFLTKEASFRERFASELLGDEFESLGYNRPYTTEAIIEYSTIHWNNKPVTSLVFSIPDQESDIRYEEIRRMFFFYLKFAPNEDLENIKEKFGDLQGNLTSWQGYNTRILYINNLVPVISSHLDQNFSLTRLNDSSLGLARVDHTSTKVDAASSKKYLIEMRNQFLTFASEQLYLLHALELKKQGYQIDENRYTSYYDRAIKWHQGFNPEEVPSALAHHENMRVKFIKGFEGEPEPIDINDFLALYKSITSIKLDYEHQKKVNPTLNLPGQ